MPQLKLPMALTGRWFPRTLNPRIAELLEPRAPEVPAAEPLLRQLDELLKPAPREFPTEPLPLWETPPPREMPRAMAPIESPPAAQPLLPIDFPSLKLDPVGPPARRPAPQVPVRDLELDPVSYEPIPMQPRSPREALVRDNVHLPPIDEDLVRRIDPATPEDWFDATRRAQMEVPLGGPEEALLNLFDDPALKGRAESAMKAIRARTSPELFQDDVLTPGLNAAARPLDDLDPEAAAVYRGRLPQTILEDLEGQAATARNVAPIDPGQFGLPDEGPTWGQKQRMFDAQAMTEAAPFSDRPGEVWAIPTPARKSLLEDADEGGVPTGGKTLRPHTRKESREREDDVVRRDVESRTTPVKLPTAAELELPWETRRGGTADTMIYGDTGITKGPWTAPEGPTFGMGERVRLPDGREGRVRQMLRSSDQVEAMVDSLGSFGSGAKDFTRHEMMAKKGTRPTKVFGPDGKPITIDAKGLKTLNLPDVRGRDLAGKTEADFADLPGPRKRMTVVESADGRLYAAAEGGLNKEGVWPGWQPAIKPVIVDVDDGTVWRGGADKVTATGEYEYEKGKRIRAGAAPQAPAAKSAEAPTVNLKGGRAFEWRSSRLTPIKVGRTKEGVDKIRVQTPGGQEFWLEVPPGAQELKGRDGKILAVLKDPAALGGALLAGGAVAGLAEDESQDPEGPVEAGMLGRAFSTGLRDALGPATDVLATLRAARAKPAVAPVLGPVAQKITDLYDATYPLKRDFDRLSAGPVPDAVNLRYKLQGLGGALGAAEPQFRAIGRVVDDLDREGLVEQLTDLASLRQASRAWRVARERFASYDTDATGASRAGAQGRARQAREQAGRLQENILGNRVAPLGLTEEAIAQQEAALRAQVGDANFEKLEQGLQDIYAQTAEVTKRRFEAGLISPEAYQRYLARGLDYIPFKRVMEDLDAQGNPVQRVGLTRVSNRDGKSVSVRETLDEEMFGSDRPGKNPLLSAVEYVEDGTREIHLNKVGQAYAQWAQSFAVPELQAAVKVTDRPPVKVGDDEGIIAFHQGGKPVFITMPKLHADVLQMVHLQDVQQGFAFLKRFRGPWQAMVTAGSPAFAIKQGLMDPLEAFLVMPWKQGLVRTAPTYAKNLGKAAKAAWQDATTGVMTPERQQWFEGGGAMSGVSGMNQTAERRAFGERFDDSLFNRVIEPIKRFTSSPQEETTKMATYWTMLDQGASPEEAMYASRVYGGTPDAYQKGAKIARYEAAFPFLNITLQGLGRTWQAVANNPARLGGVLVATGMVQSFLDRHNQTFLNPETQAPFYDDITDEDKERSWIYFLDGEPQRAADGRLFQPNIRVPKPPGLRTLLGTAGAVVNQGLEPVDRALKAVNANLPGADIPITKEHPIRSAAYRAIGSTNPAPKAAFEQLANVKTFTGAPVVGKRIEGYFPELQETAATSAVASGVSDLIGHAVSPARVDHLLETLLPGLGEMALSGVDALVKPGPTPAMGPQEAIARAPVTGVVARPFLGPMRSAERQRLGDTLSEASQQSSQAAQSLNRLLQTGDLQGFQQVLADHPDVLQQRAINPVYGQIQRQLSQLGRIREMARTGTLGLEGQALTDYLGQLGQAERALQLQAQALSQALENAPLR